MKSNNLSKSELLEAFARNNREFTGLGFVNADGITEVHTSGAIGLDLSDRDYFQEARKGNAFITDVIIGRIIQKPIVIVSAPVYDYEGQFHGLVVGSIELTTINSFMKQFQDTDKEIYIVPISKDCY
ncbi:hypothetical protein UACE39S_05318 [Ureibacillus acetophenoni]